MAEGSPSDGPEAGESYCQLCNSGEADYEDSAEFTPEPMDANCP